MIFGSPSVLTARGARGSFASEDGHRRESVTVVPLTYREITQKKVLECAMDAVQQDEPFVFTQGSLNIDSVGRTGLIRTNKGAVLLWEYDSAPCGNPTCRERFSAHPCPNPNTYMDGQWRRFGCEVR